MGFTINLATEPYQDAGRFYRRWLLALAVVTILSAILLYTAANAWRASHDAGRQLRQLKQTLAQLNADQKADEAILNLPENRDVRVRGEFLNDAIRRKAFSWTQVFSELERIMPTGLHVVSVQPEVTPDNEVAISMVVAGDSRERGLDLMRRMEQSKSFRRSALVNETTSTQPPDTVQFEIHALYTSPLLAAAAPATQDQARSAGPGGGR